MGQVFLAEDTSLDRKVALKFLPDFSQSDEQARKRFLREAKAAAALDHPYICKIYEVGKEDGRPFMAMEYVHGETLKDKLGKGRLALRDALQAATEIAEALEEAHKLGIVHRDLKPSNIMITPQGHIKVMDFGLAKRLLNVQGGESQEQTITASLTKTGATIGTVAYMSPEQLRGGKVDTRSDIFSFGIVLYEMLTGIHPFKKPEPLETALGEAYIALAQAKWRPGWDWSAQDEFRRGLALSPNYATGHQWYGGYLMAMGRQREGIEELKRAVALDPLSLIVNVDLAAVGYYFAREYEQAVTQLQKVLELDPHFHHARLHLCQSYVQLGEYREAIAEGEQAVELSGRSPGALRSLGHAYALAGRREAARAVIEELEARAKDVYVPAYDVAVIYTGLGLHEEALAWFEKAFEERSIRMEWIKVDPKLDPLRSNSRFQDWVRRMNFPN